MTAIEQTSRPPLRVIGISGSLRRDSYNRKLLQVAKAVAVGAGAEVGEVDLKELVLPTYDEDLVAAGPPETVRLMKERCATADVLIIASPEYNYSIPGGLKNALDWLSRGDKALKGKVAAIVGASAGPFGTIRMQPHLRQVLEALNMLIVSQPQVMIRSAADAFAPDGSLRDPKLHAQVSSLVLKTLALANAIRSTATEVQLP